MAYHFLNLIIDLYYLNLFLTYWSKFWCGRQIEGSCVLSVVLMNEGLHRSGDKVQLKMNAGAFSPPDRRAGDGTFQVADLACLELRVHPENAGDFWSRALLKHSGKIVTSTS